MLNNYQIVENQVFSEERALYGTQNILVKNCKFQGEEDGESALKECSNVNVENCFWDLRYPFWHDTKLNITSTELSKNCRAALWYSKDIHITQSKLHGIKALRECSDIQIDNTDIISDEFGWMSKNIKILNSKIESSYVFLKGKNIFLSNFELNGKYSFQYVKNAKIYDSKLNTKDAFWHGENIEIVNCEVNGEYLGWYSKNLTFRNCTIKGTQPFCYCKNLKLVYCKMIDTDLAFEKSEVYANITTPVISIKNPYKGKIALPKVDELILTDSKAKCKIITT